MPEMQAPQPARLENNDLKMATEFLFENNRIGSVRTHCRKHHRYVNLNSQAIFNALVELYSGLFKTQWHHFGGYGDSFAIPAGVHHCTYAARCYISTWFRDVYVSNIKAVKELPYVECFPVELLPVATEYLLNASLRPTHIIYANEDALYIPVFSNDIDAASANPFGIDNFVTEIDFFYGLLHNIKQSRKWKMTRVSTNTTGRPFWLFDWHSDNRVCAWFHAEGNYNYVDVTLAYIIGVPCTPNLGPRDVDDWQYFPQGNVPPNVTELTYERLTDRRFFGSYEVRTITIDADYVLPIAIEDLQVANITAGSKVLNAKGLKKHGSRLSLTKPRPPHQRHHSQ